MISELLKYDLGAGVEAFSTRRESELPYPVIQGHQVHEAKVAFIDRPGMTREELEGYDVFVTSLPGVAIGVKVVVQPNLEAGITLGYVPHRIGFQLCLMLKDFFILGLAERLELCNLSFLFPLIRINDKPYTVTLGIIQRKSAGLGIKKGFRHIGQRGNHFQC